MLNVLSTEAVPAPSLDYGGTPGPGRGGFFQNKYSTNVELCPCLHPADTEVI